MTCRNRIDWTATALLAAVVVLLSCLVALLVLDRFWMDDVTAVEVPR